MKEQSPQQASESQHRRYVLMTAAYNEEENIQNALESVIAQTLLPERWVIVSDGSTDKTDEIIQSYEKRFGFIRFLRRTKPAGRSFGSKVMALRFGSELFKDVEFDFIGNLDADITLQPSYFENLIAHFLSRPKLGLAGGFVCEEVNGTFESRRANRVHSVAHAAQVVRKECYEAIGGYAILEYGGEDWHAQISAGMKGWEIEAFPELEIRHHRHTGEGDNLLRHKFRQGRMDYSLGCAAFFEFLKCAERVPEKPFVMGSVARFSGYVWSWIRRDRRPVSNDFVAFLRREQNQKVLSSFGVAPSEVRTRGYRRTEP